MSKFSGKCDFYDHIFMTSEDLTDEELFEKFKGTKLYKNKPQSERVKTTIDNIKDNWEEIKYNSIKDLIPYYPYIITIGFFNNKSNNSIVVLSSESYVDIHEREVLEWYLKNILMCYNRAKRKKEPFNKQQTLLECCYNGYNKDVCKELIDRVDKYGKKATIDGIETTMSKYYREELRKEMEKYENSEKHTKCNRRKA